LPTLEEGHAEVLFMWPYVLFVFGPVVAGVALTLYYVLERLPEAGSKWIDFLKKYHAYREERRRKR
jgi:hypothetical protein